MDGQAGTYVTQVVGVGVEPLDLADLVPAGTPGPRRIAADPDRAELAELTALLVQEDEAGHGVLAVVPAAHAEPAVRHLRTTASALGGASLAVHVTHLPEAGVGALVALAAVLGAHAPVGVLGGAMERLESELTILAALRSSKGTGLGLGARLRTLLPSGVVALRRHPEPRAATCSRDELPGALAALVPPGSALSATGSGREADPAAVARAAGALALPAGEAIRGRRGAGLELVAFPADLAGVTQRVLGLPAAPCPWCGEPAAATPCPQCGHRRNPALEGAFA